MKSKLDRQEVSAEESKWIERLRKAIVLLLLLIALILLWIFFPRNNQGNKYKEIPINLHSVVEGNYHADPTRFWNPGVNLTILKDIITELEPDSENVEERVDLVFVTLSAPVPTAQPQPTDPEFTKTAVPGNPTSPSLQTTTKNPTEYGTDSPTPTGTLPTPTNTPSPNLTETSQISSTTTTTLTSTPTPDKTKKQSPTVSLTYTLTLIYTQTRTFSPTPSLTLTYTIIPSPTSVHTNTVTSTITPIPTKTKKHTPFPTHTDKATQTLTSTPTYTPNTNSIPTSNDHNSEITVWGYLQRITYYLIQERVLIFSLP